MGGAGRGGAEEGLGEREDGSGRSHSPHTHWTPRFKSIVLDSPIQIHINTNFLSKNSLSWATKGRFIL